MLLTYDVGSLPLRVEETTIWEGAKKSQTLLSLVGVYNQASQIFENEVVSAFSDKVKTGIDVPNYPQFRDMNEMFFGMIQHLEKAEGGYVALRTPSVKAGSIVPEVNILKRNSSRIRADTGIDKVRIKVCVTGPYTLSSFFPAKSPKLIEDLGRALSEIVSHTVFNTRQAEVSLVFIDEPVLGFIDDPLIDYGSEGREALRKAWDDICHSATSQGIETGMHLHNTSEDLFWHVEHLKIVESHVDDPLYTQDSTKKRLEETDKKLKAAIAVTLFDNLLEACLRRRNITSELPQKIGEIWNEIRHGRVDPHVYLEDPTVFNKRLRETIEKFGEERVTYAGPECGLESWPTYETAIECLEGISKTVKEFNKSHT